MEKPLLHQLAGLGWEIIDLTDEKQTPAHTFRDNFTDVVMPKVLREQLKVINPWLADDQVEEAAKQLTASFPGTGLIENNQYALHLLLENTSVSENRQTGEQSPTVRFIDFHKNPLENNRFIAVCQFKVRIRGTEHHIIPDIVLFVNGLPLVLIECKSPKVKDAIGEAIDQMMRYSEQRGAKGEGSAPLFYFNQFVVATCRQEAKFGTITTHNEKHFYRWSDPYPRTLDDLDHGSGSPNDQQRLAAGMMDRGNLLDIMRTFTLFSTNDKGQTIKIVGRYQQFRAVKLAVRRLLQGKNPRERSGIIWHTQGSGKSLTMMFMVREMYRHAALSNWKVVFVTDRTQLESQLNETSCSIDFICDRWLHASTSQYPLLGAPTRFRSPMAFNFSMFLSMAVVLMPMVSAITLFETRGLLLIIWRIFCWFSTNPSTNPPTNPSGRVWPSGILSSWAVPWVLFFPLSLSPFMAARYCGENGNVIGSFKEERFQLG